MRFTVRHFYSFGPTEPLVSGSGIDGKKAWDRLRMDARETNFSIPVSRDEWLRLCQGTVERDGGVMSAERARDVLAVVRDLGLRGIASFGVGGAYLEYNIKSLRPDLFLSCSDYTPAAVERLRNVFTECDEIACVDLERDPLPVRPDRLCLLSRIETEFSNARWEAVFGRLADQGAEHVLMVPHNYLTLHKFIDELTRRIKGRLTGRPLRFAGYIRTRDAIAALWAAHYDLVRTVHVGVGEGLLLRRKPHSR